VSGADALHDKLSASSLSAEMDDVDSADLIEVAMEAKDAATEGSEQSSQACAEAAEACGFELELLKLLPLAPMPKEELQELVRSFAEESSHIRQLAKVSSALLKGAGVSVDDVELSAAMELLEPFRDEAADAARTMLEKLEASLERHRATIAELQPVMDLERDFGESHEWFALHNNCFTANDGGFEYRLCPFDTITQDGRSLGKYSGWQRMQPRKGSSVHNAAMAFSDGEACGGRPRSARVHFECGEEDKLLSVSEPATCAYEALFATPSVCSTEQIRKQHEELEAAAKAAGLVYRPDHDVKKLLGMTWF
jgi:hypothetical protein